MIRINEILGCPNNRRHGTTGFCGDRLNCQRIDDCLGFVGIFDFFHDCSKSKLDLFKELLPLSLFKDLRSEKVLGYDWYPTHIRRIVKAHYVDYVETKTITRNDVAISEINIINRGIREEEITPYIFADSEERVNVYGRNIQCVRRIFPAEPFMLRPGERRTIIAAAGLGLEGEEIDKRLSDMLVPCILERLISQECDFYAAVIPEFHCTDEYIEKTYYYRHYVLRRNLSAPGTGYLKHPVFYEGKQGGYARLITASASLILDECRWWRDPRYGYGHMLNCMENLPYHGIFRDLWVNEIRSLDWPGYEEWISRAMADYLLVHPDQVMAEKVIEAGYHNIQGLLQHKDKNNNYLLNPGGHHMTQEHAPSFTSFDDYRDWYDYTDIERVEFQAFFYGNIVGIARLMQLLGDKRYAELYELAAKIRQAVIASMWDKEDDFFYAVRESDGIKAKCKEANGFLAFLFDLVPYKKPYTNIFRYFIDDRYFWNPYPVSSCAKDVPSYTPHTQMWGNQRKRAGCTWSGPTWPYMNSLLVNVLAGLLRKELSYDITMEHFRNFFQLLTQLHFEDGIPMIREDYDGIDGTPRGCADYLHSTYIDLVVRYALGVDPSRKEISDLQPMLGLDASIEGFPLGGKLWNISIDKSGHCKVVCV